MKSWQTANAAERRERNIPFAEAFSEELLRAKSWGMTQTRLAAMVGRSQSAISEWKDNRSSYPSHQEIYAAERALRLTPGWLSRHVSCYPLYILGEPNIEVDIMRNPRLNDDNRRLLIDGYRALRV